MKLRTPNSKLFEAKENLRPYNYPLYADIHTACVQSPWSWLEVRMAADLLDWERISSRDRRAIAGILKGFTLIEGAVGCYWREVVARYFKQPEIVNLATTFAHQETIHMRGYDYLESTMGLDTYQAFLEDEDAKAKLGYVMDSLLEIDDIPTFLAIFSGAIEGVSLFASFATLLSFNKKGLFKGMGQILSWSVNEEQVHSKTGISLYQSILREDKDIIPNVLAIKEGFRNIVKNELNCLDNIFAEGNLSTIDKDSAIDYVYYRANMKLMELKLKPIYDLNGNYREIKHYFETSITKGRTKNDFFAVARNGGGYSAKIEQDFTQCKYY